MVSATSANLLNTWIHATELKILSLSSSSFVCCCLVNCLPFGEIPFITRNQGTKEKQTKKYKSISIHSNL